jgi:LacI family transcriptional regulator, gluconate utilization system Gnt-I transcriptional repressor
VDKEPRGTSGINERRGRSTGAVTLGSVAKITGVSPITVSRVLNHPELVSPRTIEVVRQGIDLTGYVPNLVAGGLASSKMNYVAAIVPSISNRIFSELLQSLTDTLWESGYQVLLGASSYPASSREEALLASILSRRPDGIVLTGIQHSDASRRRLAIARIPVVELYDLTPTPIDMVIGFSNEKIGQEVAEFLLGLGHHSFGVLAPDDPRSRIKRDAFLSALRKHGISDQLSVDIQPPAAFQNGREALSRLLDLGPLPRAVFCPSDVVAHGVIAEAQARGLAVPRDLAIVGFGDIDLAAYTSPPLSTVRIENAFLGRQAAEALLSRFQGKIVERVRDIGFQIIQRGTT